eukprot:13242777-Alexandrium_andersonii.AAC.1
MVRGGQQVVQQWQKTRAGDDTAMMRLLSEVHKQHQRVADQLIVLCHAVPGPDHAPQASTAN